LAALADGAAAAATRAAETAWQRTNPLRELFTRALTPAAEAALACDDLATARRWADENVAALPGWQAERDCHEALKIIAAETQAYLRADDALECLARLVVDDGTYQYAARLLGAAQAMRERMTRPRYPTYQAGYDAAL
jgi:hypothetical protein